MEQILGGDAGAGRGVARALRRGAPVFLIVTLVALFLAPLAIGARIVAASSKLSDVDDPTRLALDVIALTTASEAAAIRAYAVLPPERRASFARDYRSARETQERAFEQLLPILPRLDDGTRAQIIALARELRGWHAVHDELLTGRMSAEAYGEVMGDQQERLTRAVAHSRAAFSALNGETAALRARLSALTRLQTAVTAGLAGLALASILVAVWLGSRARQLDAALREQLVAEKLAEARADVLSWVSHDLKNPLAAIRMGCTNLRRSLEKNPARAPFIVDTIDRSALRMSRLIRDLLDGARLDAGRALVMDTRVVDLKELMERTCEEAEQLAGGEVKVSCALPGDLPSVRGDRLRLEQALLNLIQNAVRASPSDQNVAVRADVEGGFIRVAVEDHGPGVPDDVLPRLFTPFRAARRGDSTGLGLSIVKAVVEAHGGHVSLETREGKGTTFYFTVPVATEAEEQASAKPA